MYLVQDIADRSNDNKGTSPQNVTARFIAPGSSNANGSVEGAVSIIRDQLRVMDGTLTLRFDIELDPKSKFIP